MTNRAPSERLVWVDVAKGIAIILVVIHHSVIFLGAVDWLPRGAEVLNAQLATFRMPLFFLASGLFAKSALAHPWSVVWTRRIVFFAYLYVIWVALRYVFFLVVPDVRDGRRGHSVGELAWSLVMPDSGMWFIYALALFSVAAKLMRPVPAAAQLVGAAVLAVAVAARWLPADNLAWRGMGLYFVFFLIGMHSSSVVRRFASAAGWPAALALASATALTFAAVQLLRASDVPSALLLASLLALTCGVAAASALSRTAFGASLAFLGRNTLPIYLIHVLLVAGAATALDGRLPPSALMKVVCLLGMSVIAIAGSVALHRLLADRAPLLFRPPALGGAARRAVVREGDRQSGPAQSPVPDYRPTVAEH